MQKDSLEIKELMTEHASIFSKRLTEESEEYLKHFIPFAEYSEAYLNKILSEKRLDIYFGLFLNKKLVGFYMLRGFDEGFETPSYGVWISSKYANKGLSTLTLYHAFAFCKKYFLSNSINLQAFYYYVDKEQGLNGGVDYDSLSRSSGDPNADLYDPIAAPVFYPNQKLDILQHNVGLRTLAKPFDNSQLDLSIYYRYDLDELRDFQDSVTANRDEKNKKFGAVLNYYQSFDYISLQLLGDYEKLNTDIHNNYGDSNRKDESCSIAGLVSLHTLDKSLKLSIFYKTFNWEIPNMGNYSGVGSGHNPVLMLGEISQERLREVEQDDAFLAHLERVTEGLRQYRAGVGAWHAKRFGACAAPQVAYFSMEYGLTECLPLYSGGLGILAGDHLKSASDLGVTLVGVGILFQKGYFRQYLTSEGWQQERYPVNDFSTLPVRPIHDPEGRPGPRPGRARRPGRRDPPVARRRRPRDAGPARREHPVEPARPPGNLTDEPYGGDGDVRIRQEIILGVGGMRVLEALGLTPRVVHMNEGHCAFLALERIRLLMKRHGLAFGEALEVVAASGVFTTHTPVPAGIDVWSAAQMARYFETMRAELGLGIEAFLDLGRIRPGRSDEGFNMAVLPIRASSRVNGVSRLHASVSRAMWKDVWPGVPEEEIPLGGVTNGIHPQSWISEEMADLYDRYLGPRWAEEPGDTRVWRRAEQIPGEELWRTHERRRERFVGFARRRLAAQLRDRGAGESEVAQASEALDPEALTIGFARRFATYKRATLILSDPDRLARILDAPGRPVQIVFAGKAHPRDDDGKRLIREIVQLARRPEFRRRIVFLEDYDQVVARYLVQGVDGWLNNPRRPMEASGTSGNPA